MIQPKNPAKYLAFSVLMILVDQTTKLLVHYYMEPGFPGQIVLLGNWLKLHYVLNPGMAFGMQLGHEYGKLMLTLFRLCAMVVICWYLIRLSRSGASGILLWALSLILAGAVGNVIDSTFYGVFLGNAPYGSSTPWFHGQVIDMIFVDFWEGFLPEWIPIWGGQYYSTPIFNVADSCIFIGVCIILIFQGYFHTPVADTEEPDSPDPEGTGTAVDDENGTGVRITEESGETDEVALNAAPPELPSEEPASGISDPGEETDPADPHHRKEPGVEDPSREPQS